VFAAPPGPVWSPDGKHLVCAVRGPLPAGFGVSLEIVDPGGTARPLPTPPWQTIAKMVWLKDSSGLMVAGQSLDEPFKQIWYVPLMAGGAVRVTNDLSYYDAVDVTADKSAMVSVQAQPLTNLYTLTLADPTHPVQITPGGGRYYDVAWTPDGNLVYASDATGSADIWIMDPKGGAPRQLTNGLARSYAPAISPDGRTVVFHSNRNGVWNLWRMGLDGSNQTQITHHTTDSNRPQVTADGASVIYQHVGGDASVTLWKAPLQGGDGTQITSGLASFPAVSREDGRIAFWYCPDPAVSKWQIGVLEPGSDTPKRAFEFPDNREPGALLRWVPGMNAISYAEERDGASNIWLQSLSGGPPRQLTNFTKGLIYSFDWSREGLLVYSQGMSTRDVVLMRDPAKMRQ
jgi:Tol biopolymer transport system component